MSDPDDYIHDEVSPTLLGWVAFMLACLLVGGVIVLQHDNPPPDLTPCYAQPRAETDGGELVAVPCEEKR